MLKRTIKGFRNRFNRFRLYRKNKVILDGNKELKNIKTGKRCFIIGNGPSVKYQNILKLKNEETFVVNNFWNYSHYAELNPKHYVFLDTNAFAKFPGETNYWKEQFANHAPIIAKFPTSFFFHNDAQTMIDAGGLFSPNKVHYITTDGFFKESLSFNIDISQIIPNTKNVIVASIIIAVYMGFEEIYLLGCEHSFLATPHKYDVTEHFYETKSYDASNLQDMKYYEPDPTTSYERLAHDTQTLFQNYRLLKTKLSREKPNVKIYNATPNSFLDVFPYIKFENISI